MQKNRDLRNSLQWTVMTACYNGPPISYSIDRDDKLGEVFHLHRINKGDELKTATKSTRQPTDWWQAFDDQARKEGMTLSAWVGECCKANLPARVAKGLSERRTTKPRRALV